jgi:hypothetical protein
VAEDHDGRIRSNPPKLIHNRQVAAFGERKVEQHRSKIMATKPSQPISKAGGKLDVEEAAGMRQDVAHQRTIRLRPFNEQDSWHSTAVL